MIAWLHSALDLLFPRTCAGCGRPDPEDRRHLCWNCLAEIPFIQPPFCSRCGDPVAGRVDHAYVCALCAGRVVHFDRARSVARYDGAVGQAVRELKYHKAVWVAPDLADLLEAGVRAHYDVGAIDAVAFVPLHPMRRRERGFNQAEILAAHLARRIHKPLLRRVVARVRFTPTQTKLTLSARADNVKNAFAPRSTRWLQGRRILLVDDVMTTGATVNACAEALKTGGAAEVWVMTVARG